MTKTLFYLLALSLGAAGAAAADTQSARPASPSPTVPPVSGQLSAREELASIVALREKNLRAHADLSRKRYNNGLADGLTTLRAARDLLVFRRDRAASLEEKIRMQEEIVQLFAEATACLQAQCSGGTGDNLEVMEALEQELAARQQLLEWKLRQEALLSGNPPPIIGGQ